MKSITWLKKKIDQWKFNRKLKKRLEELKKRDPFVYKH
jgi:hypothetical protein